MWIEVTASNDITYREEKMILINTDHVMSIVDRDDKGSKLRWANPSVPDLNVAETVEQIDALMRDEMN